MKFDDLLREIGEFGPYQKQVFFLAVAPAILCAMESFSVVFILHIPSHRCELPDFPGDTYNVFNETHAQLINYSIPVTSGELDKCHVFSDVNETANGMANASAKVQSACNRWVFDQSTMESTAATDFNIVCSQTYKRANSNLIADLGMLVGTFICGFISDRFGRKLTFCIGAFCLLGAGMGIAFTTSFLTFNICRFTIGMARKAVFMNGLLIAVEMVGPSKRALAAIFPEFTWCIGEVVLLAMAYFIRNWRHLEIALSVPAVVLLAYWWLIPESPRWLASRGRHEEAKQVLEKIATSNKTKLPDLDHGDTLLEEGGKTLPFWHVFRSRELVLRLIFFTFDMWVITVVYYALTLNITNLSGNLFLNFALSTLMELLGYVSSIFLAGRIGRKAALGGSVILAGVACTGSIIPVLLGAPGWIVVALSLIGRFCDCVAFAVIFLYAAELFPTVIRSSAMGFGSTLARVGNTASPYLADLGVMVGGQFKDALPLISMGLPAILFGVLSLWLPETLDLKLPETFEDVEQPGSKKTCACLQRKGQKERKKGGEATLTNTLADEEQPTIQC